MLCHAVPVFVIGIWLADESALTIAAIISAVIGMLTGNPMWILADLFAVFIAYSLAMTIIDTGSHSATYSETDNNPFDSVDVEKPAINISINPNDKEQEKLLKKMYSKHGK